MKAHTANPVEFRASAPFGTIQDQLGPLAELPGTWVGKGFNLISLPLHSRRDHKGPAFRLKLNAIHETLTFATTGVIPNRGFIQPDISFYGLHYLQQVYDAETNELLHIEPGLWLNLPRAATDPPPQPPWNWSVARLSTIPHGNALFAQGPYKTSPGGPVFHIAPVDHSTPFTLDSSGNRVDKTDAKHRAPFDSAKPPPGIPKGAIKTPIILLDDALKHQRLKHQKIVETVVLTLSAAPVGDIDQKTHIQSNPNSNTNIMNIPFVVANATANSFAAIFWIETVQNPDGSCFMQLQYTQTVILEFDGLKWPHISVATLIKR